MITMDFGSRDCVRRFFVEVCVSCFVVDFLFRIRMRTVICVKSAENM